MTTQSLRQTAKIYTFPSGGRAPPSRYRDTGSPSHFSPRVAAPQRDPKIVYGSSWYHQDAVDESEDFWGR
jgi:hypothetical protein